MKKRLLSLLLAVCTALSLLVVPAGAAASRYSDVTDQNTATMVEVLRIMGVMDGYNDGSFRPGVQLNRAQFCKMATYAMNKQQQLGLYRTVTVFPDVKPSYWAAPYINLAARTGAGGTQAGGTGGDGAGAAASVVRPVIAGYPDGKFHPERVVTMGQAVTILLRILGYQETDIGGVWPDSYMATGAVAGLLRGLPTNGNTPLTRGQAAQLFVNLLDAKGPSGTLYDLSKEEVTLLGIDGGLGTMKVSGDLVMEMVHPVKESNLVGMSGRLVMVDGKALTFLPSHGTGTGSSAGAVVIYKNGSAAGLNELAGNGTYQLYKNGTPAGAADLRQYDVATYYPGTNSILVSDTRVSVYYEDCEPNVKAPTSITALGTEFKVLPAAQEMLSKFKPGDQMTLLLTADGNVAGAVQPDEVRGNAIGFVDQEGGVQMFCGSTVKKLGAAGDSKYIGQAVRISSEKKGVLGLSAVTGGAGGSLDVETRQLGGKPLTESAIILENGKQVGLSQLDRSVIPSAQIRYAHTNWAGQVDIVVIDRAGGEIFGKLTVKTNTENGLAYLVKVENGVTSVELPSGSDQNRGDYVAARVSANGKSFESITPLTGIRGVSNTAWTGTKLVRAGGYTYEVSENVQCYNRSTKSWITLEKALSYGDTTDLYVKDGIVRIVEIG